MGLSKDQMRQAFSQSKIGFLEKPLLNEDIYHKEWNIIVEYYVNTHDYDPKNNSYYKGLELFHTDYIPLCAHKDTECYFSEVIFEDNIIHVADECRLHKVEPGYYKCVCGVKIEDVTSSSWDGETEYDTEVYYEMLSRTKLTNADIEYIMEINNVNATYEELDISDL